MASALGALGETGAVAWAGAGALVGVDGSAGADVAADAGADLRPPVPACGARRLPPDLGGVRVAKVT
ncbi:MAG TPA: hypothetical protein VL984_01410 [Acidimicrobiales bacterium]|nr:hypothetical protein [Acidimicrobiales bacterium]